MGILSFFSRLFYSNNRQIVGYIDISMHFFSCNKAIYSITTLVFTRIRLVVFFCHVWGSICWHQKEKRKSHFFFLLVVFRSIQLAHLIWRLNDKQNRMQNKCKTILHVSFINHHGFILFNCNYIFYFANFLTILLDKIAYAICHNFHIVVKVQQKNSYYMHPRNVHPMQNMSIYQYATSIILIRILC